VTGNPVTKDVPVKTLPTTIFVGLAVALTGSILHQAPSTIAQSAARTTTAPVFEVDPDWPKALPNGWTIGPVSGIAVDAGDHVVLVQRAEAITQAGGTPAPHVIEFDPLGAVVRSWGGAGAGYEWLEQVHGLSIDHKDRVWISGNGEKDGQILAFTRTGAFIRQIGKAGRSGGSNDTANVGRATQMRFDPQQNEVFVSDGEGNQNHRVIVFDSETGAYKRHWGAYGARPDDGAVTLKFDPTAAPPKQFGSAVHCLRISRDGLVYVCDRANNRFHVFRKDGTFVREVFIAKETGGTGSVWDIDFSPDQTFMYVADGTNQKVWVLRRDTLTVEGSFGGPGKAPGQFATSLHDIVVDSKGNLFTGEAASAGRVQKFRPR
jgi:DNA-binding beta-propeller fold protein YncE